MGSVKEYGSLFLCQFDIKTVSKYRFLSNKVVDQNEGVRIIWTTQYKYC